MVVSAENFGGTLTMPWIPMEKNDDEDWPKDEKNVWSVFVCL